MTTLFEIFSGDHRHCDDLFAEIERAVHGRQWANARTGFDAFRAAMERHLDTEEQVLFPAFENASGMTMGPTQVMRMEHLQLRELFERMDEAIAATDTDGYLGQAETLLIMMQQHNMKEEGILYPMCDQHLARAMAELEPLVRERLALVV